MSTRTRVCVAWITIALLVSACAAPRTQPSPFAQPSTTVQPVTLTVFAAASLTDAFSEIGAAFHAAQPGVIVQFNFGGSQNLRTQLEQGAQADVFASANQREMDNVVEASLIAAGTPKVFLTNQLVIILPENNPANVAALEDLARPGLKLVLTAEEVPAGGYTRGALDKMQPSLGADFKERVLANVVSNEDNVKQVVAKVRLGEADAGIVYGSDAVAAPALKTISIPAELNVIATYPIAALANAQHAEPAAAFVAFVLSPNGQSILKKWGFAPPNS